MATQKTFSDNVLAAVEAAADTLNLKGAYSNLAEAKEALKGREFFDPSLSQFVPGTILNFDPETMRYGIANIGTRGAAVVTVPAGHRDAKGAIVYDRAMNVYLSSTRKEIRVTDETGEPVLDENGAQTIINGKGNELWEQLAKCHNEAEVLDTLSGKVVEITDVKKGFGPSNFVKVGESMVPKGHRLTSLPLMKVIG